MDPLMHLVFPLLFLLAMKMEPKKALLFAPIAILPDFDALFGLHRALGHSFIPDSDSPDDADRLLEAQATGVGPRRPASAVLPCVACHPRPGRSRVPLAHRARAVLLRSGHHFRSIGRVRHRLHARLRHEGRCPRWARPASCRILASHSYSWGFLTVAVFRKEAYEALKEAVRVFLDLLPRRGK